MKCGGASISRRESLGRLVSIAAGSLAALSAGEVISPPRVGADTVGVGSKRRRLAPDSNGVDDTASVQSLLNQGEGEVVFRAGGKWLIDGRVGLSPASGTRIVIEEGSILQVISNSYDTYRLFNVGRDGPVSNITIEGGGSILGDVETHTGNTGQYGHLVYITQSANVSVLGGLTIAKAWGDGIYIGHNTVSRDIIIDGVVIDDCRRQGIGAFWVDGCTISNSKILNTGSTRNVERVPESGSGTGGPGSGIDCEPPVPGHSVKHLTIQNCLIQGTSGCGILVTSGLGVTEQVIIRDNQVLECGTSTDDITTYQANGIHIAEVGKAFILNNTVESSGPVGHTDDRSSGQILLRACVRPVLEGGQINRGRGRGVFLWACESPVISGVAVEKNEGAGICTYKSNGAVIIGNKLLDNAFSSSYTGDHVEINHSSNCVVDGNSFRGDGGRSWIGITSTSRSTLLAGNKGSGVAPPSALSDEGIDTAHIGNVLRNGADCRPWIVSDANWTGSCPS